MAVGGAVIGWFAGTLIVKVITGYLKSHPSVVFKLTSKWGSTKFYSYMKFLGINPFTLTKDTSKFIAIARLFNNKSITLSLDWVKTLYSKAKSLGFKIVIDSPHGGYSWHIHISGSNGRLNNLHIQISKNAYEYLKKILK